MNSDPNTTPPRESPPTLEEAAALLTEPRVFIELAYHGRNCRTRDELIVRLEQAAIVHDRASDGFAERKRYDLAAGERESARHLRRWAEALRVMHKAATALTRM